MAVAQTEAMLAVVGRPLPRVDGAVKVTGEAAYVGDMKPAGMLIGKLLRSPHPHARILHVDASLARRVPGVKCILTGADVPRNRFGAIIPDEQILALDKVRYIGDAVAAVAALDAEGAYEALDLIRVEYEELPAVFDPAEAMKPGAPLIHEDKPGNIARHVHIERGNVEQGFAEADYVYENTFRTQHQYQLYIEPDACMAASDSSGRVTLWLPTQSPFSSRENLAQALGVDVSRIRIIQPPIGGAFGAKLAGKPQHVAACLLAMRTHRPVKIVYDREEDMATMVPRVATTIHMRIGFKRDGTMTTKQARIIADNGAYCSHAYNIVFNMSQRMDCLYRFQHTRTETDLVYTNKIATGAFRGFGNPQSHFAMESCIDSASEALGLDPAEVRLKNASRQGDTTIHGWQLRSCALVDCIQKAAEGIGWKEKRHLKGSGRGVGMACVIHVSSNRKAADWDGSNALVKVHEDGRLAVVTGEVDMGQGTLTVLAQIAAEEFGVPIDRVEIGGVDTDIAPYCQGASSSRTVTLGGSAVRAAAAEAKRQLFEVAAEKLEARVDDLEARGGRIFVRGAPDRAMTIGQAAKAHLFRKGGSAVIGRGSFDPPTRPPDEGFYGDLSTAYPFACQAAEVEVDRETGQVRVLNFVAAHDIGKVINPITAEGQVEGAVQQGMGYGLTEQLVFDGGKVLNNNLMNYLSLTAPDMPSIKTVFVESNDPWGPYGAKGLAEPGLIPTAPAIANAIFHAIGVRIPDLPITQEKVLRALKEQAQKA